MSNIERGGPRRAPHESAGSVDHPFDEDRPASHQLIQSDAACSVPWLEDGYQAVQLFVDPAVRDRAEQLCETIGVLCGRHTDLDSLSEAIQRYAEGEGLSASVHERPRDELSSDIVAVAITFG